MTAFDFVQKWAAAKGGEKASAHEHFIDLCRLLGEPTPTEADPAGDFYAFEKGARTPDGNGFSDVWLKNHFAWEYKGKRKDLIAAYKQVSDYREALGNPPLLVVCDFERYEVHTNWTNTEKWIYRFRNADIATDDLVDIRTVTDAVPADAPKVSAIQVLKALWEEPDKLRPTRTTAEITEQAASIFGNISKELRKWGVDDDMHIARFITKMLFCMFATDVGLLPKAAFSDLLIDPQSRKDNKGFRKSLSELFKVMNTGGKFGAPTVPHFNGRLFTDADVPENITTMEIIALGMLDALNWAEVEPAIFGTLFERILDPSSRKKLGAHYTSRADIELIVEPVLMTPLRREWNDVKRQVEELFEKAETRANGKVATAKRVRSLLEKFHYRVATIQVLDPACGSGNFLYVSLALLKALEKEVIAFASIHGVAGLQPKVHPRQLHGLEISPYAVELASIVIWIGYIQWKHRNVLPLDDEEPILQPLDQIELKDAIVDDSGRAPREPKWPVVDVIVGNPPFLGGKQLRKNLGDAYVEKMFAVWDGRVGRESDLCCYWFEKARAEIEGGHAKRAGLLATQAIRGGKNRRVLERIKESGDIFYAQADRKWIQDGVAVRVSMVGFDGGTETRRRLNELPDDEPLGALERAVPVEEINANLTSRADATQANRLKENVGISFMGDTKVGPFEISGTVARRMLAAPNPHGKPNSDVVRPWVNGLDITRRPRGMWIIDFPPTMTESEAALYETPFAYVQKLVKPGRSENKRVSYAQKYWIHGEPRPEMRAALSGLWRYLGTPRVQRQRAFVWLDARTLADSRLFVFARGDDYFFGVIQSKAHLVWALATASRHGVGNDPTYNNTTCFETFPFPHPSEAQQVAVAKAAKELNEWRTAWLNPSDDGLGMTTAEKNKRTLTNLYNQHPAWLDNAHAVLDAAVFESYGWPESPAQLSDQEILGRLLSLNLEREPA